MVEAMNINNVHDYFSNILDLSRLVSDLRWLTDGGMWWLRNFVAHCTTAILFNCEMPSRTKPSLLLFCYEQELSQTVLPALEDVFKSYLLVEQNTKQEHGDQQPSIAAPQLKQLWP